MAYVPVPKDLNAVKTKVLLNLTKRQLICFGAGAALGVPLFFLLKTHTGVSTAAICMIMLMLPFFLLAMYEKNGQPLEKIVRNSVQVCFLRPKQRPYAKMCIRDSSYTPQKMEETILKLLDAWLRKRQRDQSR